MVSWARLLCLLTLMLAWIDVSDCLASVPKILEQFDPKLKRLRRAYAKISKNLDKIPTNDPEKLMEVVNEWIQKESESTDKNPNRVEYLKALIQFHFLSLTEGEDHCTPNTRDLILTIDKAMQASLSTLKPGQKPEGKMNKIIYHYAYKHALECDMEAVNAYVKQIKTIQKAGFVRHLMHNLVVSHYDRDYNLKKNYGFETGDQFMKQDPYGFAAMIQRMKLGGERDAGVLYDSLIKLVKMSGKESKMLKKLSSHNELDVLGFWNMIREYLSRPCGDFVTKLQHIYEKDIAVVRTKADPSDYKEEEISYLHDLAYYRGCISIVPKENEIMTRMKRYARRSSD